MSNIIDMTIAVLTFDIEAVHDEFVIAWNNDVMPVLEEVFSWFGIVDEEVIITEKTSVLIFEETDEDVIHAANVKSVMSMTTAGGSFFLWYMQNTRQIQAQIRSFYRYAEREKYIHGLPDMEVKGQEVDFTAIDLALDIHLGFDATRLDSNSQFPSDEIHFKDKIQATPYFYLPWANTLTFTDPYGVSRDDYTFTNLVYNIGPDTFDIVVSREAEHALFWIEGPVHIVEGDSATYTLKCNRIVPTGESVLIGLAYTGTAPPTDYTEVLTATMLGDTQEIDIVVATNENVAVDGSRTIIVTIDSVTNTNAAFESVGIHAVDSVTTTITDDEGVILTMPSILVNEADLNAIIPVKLEEAAAGAFTVDYAMTNGTALGGGIDYDSTPGTLNFAGTAGEIQNITIPITTDAADDNEYFTVHFTACSDPAVDFSYVGTVTITDDSDVTPLPSTITLSDVIVEPNYVRESAMIVTYHANTDPAAEWFYWIYLFSSNTYPDIDPSMNVITNTDMMPIGILRKDKISINVDKTTQEYKTTKRLLDLLFLDIDEVIANIEDNPDIDSVDDVFINFAVNPTSTVEMISRILWLSFYNIIVTHTITSNNFKYSASFSEQDVQNSMVWSEHSHTADIAGTLASGRDYEHEIIYIEEITEWNPDTETDDVIQEAGSELHIRYQTAPGLYGKLVIHNLSGMAAIQYDGYHKIAANKLGDDNFTIPISYFILNELGPLDQMVVYKHILRLDIYSLQVVVIDWYMTSIFQTLFTIVAIVITVWTAGAAGGIWAVLQQLVINYAVMELVLYIAEATGNAELAAIVGLVAMIALGASGAMPAFDLASAEGLVSASTNFANNLSAGYGTISAGIASDITELNERAQERLDEITDASPEESPITADFLVALQSVDTSIYPAVNAQFDYDILYNYDRIIADYHDLHIKTGVI